MTTENLSAFAKRLEVSPSYITKLKDEGRLVLTEDGKVDVDASLARIKETEDPNRADVRERWKDYRQNGGEERPQAPPANELTPRADDSSGKNLQAARAVKERYLALDAKAAYEERIGILVEAESVKRAGAEVGAILRGALENLPDQLAPIIAPINDEAKVHALLVDHIETILNEISSKLSAIGSGKNSDSQNQ
jgi:hypothetical protein